MNTQDEGKAFEEWFDSLNRNGRTTYFLGQERNIAFEAFRAATARAEEKLEGCVVVNKKDTEDWYLDPGEYMWFDRDGIDSTLCDMNIGEVTAIEHKEYLITVSDTIYAAKVWDSKNEDVGFWEFFKTEAEAEKAAAHCKSMVEAASGGND